MASSEAMVPDVALAFGKESPSEIRARVSVRVTIRVRLRLMVMVRIGSWFHRRFRFRNSDHRR